MLRYSFFLFLIVPALVYSADQTQRYVNVMCSDAGFNNTSIVRVPYDFNTTTGKDVVNAIKAYFKGTRQRVNDVSLFHLMQVVNDNDHLYDLGIPADHTPNTYELNAILFD